MPTPDQFRAARTLLGLTQYRCRECQVEFIDHGPMLGAKCRLDHTEHSGEVFVAENAIHGTE